LLGSADAHEDKDQQGEEDVDAHFYAHPSSQRD
jgi:hypothetical protein